MERACTQVFLLFVAGLVASGVKGFDSSDWMTSTATFYGGKDAAGTMGGACGYGNLYQTGYGTATAAASIAMFQSGAVCGTCIEVRCVNNKYCKPGESVVITVTNLCPQGSYGGWCNYPRQHLDMAFPSWNKIATDPVAGIVSTQMRRVPCQRQGGISFHIAGNPFWTQILTYNVGGPGNVMGLSVSKDQGSTWLSFQRNWGTVWSGPGNLLGHSLTIKVTAGENGQQLTIPNAIPVNWYLGGVWTTNANFYSSSSSSYQGSSSSSASPSPSPPPPISHSQSYQGGSSPVPSSKPQNTKGSSGRRRAPQRKGSGSRKTRKAWWLRHKPVNHKWVWHRRVWHKPVNHKLVYHKRVNHKWTNHPLVYHRRKL